MVISVLCIGLFSCGGGDDDPVELNLSPTSISLDYRSGSNSTFSITCNSDWSITGIPDWISLSQSSGKGNSTIVVTATSENRDSSPRSGSIVVTCGDITKIVNVTQNQTEYTNSIVGTWFLDVSDVTYYDRYTLVFNNDNSGYIQNDYGSRADISETMYFDWSLTDTSDGRKRLSVIYTRGDKDILPFEGHYAQWNLMVTVAGGTLSVQLSNNTVMLFKRM